MDHRRCNMAKTNVVAAIGGRVQHLRNAAIGGRILHLRNAAIACLLLFPFSSASQTPPIRVDVGLIQIVATVTDRADNYVTNLGAEDFIVEVDGVAQKVAHFTRDTETPMSIGLLLDTSASMKPRLAAARQAAITFVREMRPRDEFFLMTFGLKTKVQQDFTEDRAKLERALNGDLGRGASTHLYSAVENAVKKLKKGKNKKRALIVISDGGDVSFGSLKKFQRKLREFEALMYPIETESKRSALARIFEPSEGDRTANMHAIAEETGGRWFGVDAKAPPEQLGPQFEQALAIVSAELRGQYSIGFYPPQLPKGASGRIRVRAANPDYSVRTRKDPDIK